MIILLTESEMDKELIGIIESQNSHYLTIIGLMVTLALAIFGVIQWKINDRKLNELKEKTIKETQNNIVEMYKLNQLPLLVDKIEQIDELRAESDDNVQGVIFDITSELTSSNNLNEDIVFSKLLLLRVNIIRLINRPIKNNTFISEVTTINWVVANKALSNDVVFLNRKVINMVKEINKILKNKELWGNIKDYNTAINELNESETKLKDILNSKQFSY